MLPLMKTYSLKCRLFHLCLLSFFPVSVLAQVNPQPETAAAPFHPSEAMTLWEIMRSGGVVMLILGILSLIMISLAVYLFLELNAGKLIPSELADKLLREIQKKNFAHAKKLCEESDSILAEIALAGLEKINLGLTAAKEAVEMTARREISGLWATLNYLSEIVQIAPMLGLLGTVLGMIQSFNTVAFESIGVKPMLLAGGISKAMVATAAGLAVAITSTFFYVILRPKTQAVTNLAETRTSQIIEALSQ